MGRILLDQVDPARRLRTVVERDAETGLPIIKARQDVRQLLSANVAAQNDYDRRQPHRVPGGWRRVARLPAVVVMQLNDRGIMKGVRVVDQQRFGRFLSDIDHRKLRTDDGKRLT